MVHTYRNVVGDKPLTIETGALAEQANGAVTVQYGDCVILVTACVSAHPREGVDFLPMTIDYEERMYAAGKIPGSFFRREGRPSQEAVLTDRLTDRTLRPLFPKGFCNDIQVTITVLSADQENPIDILSIIGASAALSISGAPFDGPVAATRIGFIDGTYVVNPTFAQIQQSHLDVVVSGTRDAVVMVEAGAKEVSEEVVLKAVQRGQEVNQELIGVQDQMVAELAKPRLQYSTPTNDQAALSEEMASFLDGGLEVLIDRGEAKGERNADLSALEKSAVEKLGERYGNAQVTKAFDGLLKKVVRRKILEEGKRPDGRGVEDIRPISSQVGLLPRTHGSGLFARGQTQVLSLATLGSLSNKQRMDTLSPEESKRFIHHYNFPAFSVGEARRVGSPGRREVGHGALAERALLPVIPSEEEFPYTIRIVSEVLSSNGSTSMASVCASSLALMDAGAPITKPVAGAAMGLIMGENGNYAVLTDIQGMEDFMGDMDFKVAGTTEGVTALQMDIKVKGITSKIMGEALEQARQARLFILGRMRETIDAARPNLSAYAPRMLRMTIPVDKIGVVIGPGGKTIRSIIAETGATVDVENDGTVVVGSPNEETARRAMETIQGLVKEIEVGEVYKGKVVRLMNFGAFVEIVPGKDGLVHISELADHRIASVEEVVKIGDEMEVMVVEIDRMGRINLSHRAVLQGLSAGQVHDEKGAAPVGRQMDRGSSDLRHSGPPRGDRRDDPPRRRFD